MILVNGGASLVHEIGRGRVVQAERPKEHLPAGRLL